jgi:hypothetical protein
MELQELERNLETLSTLEEDGSPLISCYLEMSNGAISSRDAVETRFQVLRMSLPVCSVMEFDEARSRIEAILNHGISTENTRRGPVCARRTSALLAAATIPGSPYWPRSSLA